MLQTMKREWKAFCLMMSCVPPLMLTFCVMSIFSMNLLANKSLAVPYEWLALDGGILLSWFAFLVMDILTKHFGPKAATQFSLVAVMVNLLFCCLFYLASLVPGMWGEAYVDGSEQVINQALDHTFGGTWYVVLGSTVAFVVASVVNNFTNHLIGRVFRRCPDSFAAYACRSYGSTALAQFVDNITFAFLVSVRFFGWSLLQCLVCAVTGMLCELLCELAFSYIGYRVCLRWKKQGVGQAYFDYLQKEGANAP